MLRYRERELALPFVLPQTFEYGFLGGVRKLTREREPTIGFLVRDGKGGSDEFTSARALLEPQYRLREVLDLELGEPVPDDVTVLVVARPTELDPRAAFAVDQYVQRGGGVLVLVDRAAVDLTAGRVEVVDTGLERVFGAWGVSVGEELAWDQERCNSIRTSEVVRIGGTERPGRQVSIPYPLWPNVDKDGMSLEAPVTAQLPGVDLFWAHPIDAKALRGVERVDLVRTSALSWRVAPTAAASVDPSALSQRGVSLLAGGPGSVQVLGVSLTGRLPSGFFDGAPAPFDPIAAALAGDEGDPSARETTDEEVLTGEQPAQVVLVGDADWVADGKFSTARNRALFVNLVDWLALEDDLIGLRSRVPKPREIDDYLEEERRRRGLIGPQVEIEDSEAHTIARLEAEAAGRAAARRRLAMLRATGGSLLAALLAGVLWRATLGRAPRMDGAIGAREGREA